MVLLWQALISRSQQTHNVEYIKNITVKYLETRDASLLRALSIALQISPEEMARVERGQAKASLSTRAAAAAALACAICCDHASSRVF